MKIWNVETGQCLRRLEGHSEPVSAVALSADRRRALSGSSDKTLKLWDLETGQCLRNLSTESPVVSLALTPDAMCALSGHQDGTITRWRLVWSLEFPKP